MPDPNDQLVFDNQDELRSFTTISQFKQWALAHHMPYRALFRPLTLLGIRLSDIKAREDLALIEQVREDAANAPTLTVYTAGNHHDDNQGSFAVGHPDWPTRWQGELRTVNTVDSGAHYDYSYSTVAHPAGSQDGADLQAVYHAIYLAGTIISPRRLTALTVIIHTSGEDIDPEPVMAFAAHKHIHAQLLYTPAEKNPAVGWALEPTSTRVIDVVSHITTEALVAPTVQETR